MLPLEFDYPPGNKNVSRLHPDKKLLIPIFWNLLTISLKSNDACCFTNRLGRYKATQHVLLYAFTQLPSVDAQ